jgi:hypothetical protein
MSISVMKMAADQQKQMANMLAQLTEQMPQPAVQNSDFSFSTYA